MIEEKQRSVMKLAAMIFIIAVGVYALVSVFNSKKICPISPVITGRGLVAESNVPAMKTESSNNTQAKPVSPNAKGKPHLTDIVRLRRTWGPILTPWYGENAPDFTATDLAGKEHKVSDYRGRNVMLIFWATWCGPCVSEIPDLMMLRNMVSQDKLAMLAISNEPAERLRPFVARRQINYTVFSYDTFSMARPYNAINGIPTCFFIDPRGKIKLVTEGAVPLEDVRAILEAE